MFKLDNRITLLQRDLDNGKIDEFQFAMGLKSFYDRTPNSFDTRSLRFMETKINEAGLPLTEGRQGRSDGVLAQTVSGLIEGFTTFGFADTPDTSTERIANNIGHLIGLAPSLVVSTITGGRAAAGVVSRGLKLRKWNNDPAAFTANGQVLFKSKEYDMDSPSVNKSIVNIYITYKRGENVLIKGFGVRAGGAEIDDNLVSGQTQELTNTTADFQTQKNKSK
jgi:hypothetical protein